MNVSSFSTDGGEQYYSIASLAIITVETRLCARDQHCSITRSG